MRKIDVTIYPSDATAIYDIQLNNCGYYKGLKTDFPTSRKNGRPDYHIIFVEKGMLNIFISDLAQTVHSGQMVFIPPNFPQRYRYTAGEDTVYYWLHFTGTKMQDFLRVFPFENTVYLLKRMCEYTAIVEEILQKYARAKLGVDFYYHAQLQLLLTKIGQDIFSDSIMTKNATRIARIIAEIKSAPETSLSNHQLAEKYGISEYHLIRIFKDETGLSPQKFRNQILLDKAKQLLQETELNISEISYLLGFTDPLYFSRIFRKLVGISPTDYRFRKNS